MDDSRRPSRRRFLSFLAACPAVAIAGRPDNTKAAATHVPDAQRGETRLAPDSRAGIGATTPHLKLDIV